MLTSFICFLIVLICIQVLLHRTGEWIHDHMVEPICIQYADKGTKGIPMFLLLGTILNSIARFISRFALWYGLHWCLLYIGTTPSNAFQFVAICVGISGLRRTSEDIRRHFPPPDSYTDNYGRGYKRKTEKKRYTYF